MSEPHVGILTPLYNNAADLAECLDSILAQTYTNWDCTVVDNCSTDGSREIARRYVRLDSRIRLVKNEQLLPAVANHNNAIRQLRPDAKYCKFVFADDWIYPECLSKMVALAEAHPSVGVVGAYVLWGEDVRSSGLPYQTTVLSGRAVCRKHLLDRIHVFGTSNSLLFRSDLVRERDPLFNERNIHADTEACFDLLKRCDFGFVHQVLTYTRVRAESLLAHADQVQSYWAGDLQVLTRHAAAFLEKSELETLLAEHLKGYYRYLGENLLLRRESGFWDFHRQSMRDCGVEMSKARLIGGLLAAIARRTANLPQTTSRLLSRVRGTRNPQHDPPVGAHANSRRSLP